MKRTRHDLNTVQLVEIVKANPILWDYDARGYRSKHLKEEAWKVVAKDCGGVPASVVRKKWKNLKDTYRKELKKDFSDWHLYSKLSFILNQFPQKDTEEREQDGSDEEETTSKKHKKYKQSGSTKKVRIDMDKLIELVQVREPIWDKDDRRHHNSYKLDELWGQISDELGCTRLQARNKWKHLRDNLRRELRKTHSDWIYFPKLAFLYPQFSMVSYFPDEDDENEENDEEPDDNIEEDHDFFEDVDHRTSEEDTIDKMDVKPVVAEFNYIEPEASTSKIKTHSPVLSMMGDVLDEDVGFFNSLMPHVKKLDSDKKMVLRMKMQEIVYNAVYSSGVK